MNTRIEQIIAALNIKKVDFANRLGVSQPFVSELCSGRKAPSDRTISDICREFNVNETWLRTGEGEMFNQITRSEKLPPFSVTSPKMMATISNVGLWRCWQSWSPRTGSFWSGWLKSCKKEGNP